MISDVITLSWSSAKSHSNFFSSHEEPFLDIQLTVDGMTNLVESLRDIVRPETLDGINQYRAGPHGLQDAERRTIFTSFPPVLYFHLKRFNFDAIQNLFYNFEFLIFWHCSFLFDWTFECFDFSLDPFNFTWLFFIKLTLFVYG